MLITLLERKFAMLSHTIFYVFCALEGFHFNQLQKD